MGEQKNANRGRKIIALVAGVVITIGVATPLGMAIKYNDWGVGLILLAPLVVWALLRMGTALERWANNEPGGLPPDPDFPDEPD
jgi:uncharacterized membrane protein YgaE (UPF0421/DUF939 family)